MAVGALIFGFQFLIGVVVAIGAPILVLIGLIVLLAAMIWQNWDSIVLAFNYLKQVVVTWVKDTYAAIVKWVKDTYATIVKWVKDTLTAIGNWVRQMVDWFWIGANALGESLIYMYQSVISFINTTWASFLEWAQNLGALVTDFVSMIGDKLTEFVQLGVQKVNQFIQAFTNINWAQIGTQIIQGIVQGVQSAASLLMNAASSLVSDLINTTENGLGILSPSKVFMAIGELTMMGFAKGIDKSAKLVERAMMDATALAISPALSLPAITQQLAMSPAPGVSNQNTYNNNYSLTVNSSARTEPIIQDYGMLQSLAGS